MPTVKEAAKDFLSQKNIAVAGVSRDSKQAANFIYRKLRTEGYTVFAVNPNAATVEGDTCYTDLKAIPVKPDGVVIVTRPEVTRQVVMECAELGITYVWIHKGIDQKNHSLSEEAVDLCHQHGIHVIPGGCPMMHCRHADIGHRLMRWIFSLSGKLPREL